MPKILPVVLLSCSVLGCSSGKQDVDEQFETFIFPKTSNEVENPFVVKNDTKFPTIGTAFTFDNPSETYTVVSVSSESFVLKDSQGNFMTISDTSWLPPIQWGGGADNTDSGRRIIESLSGTPNTELKVGNKYSFRIKTQNDRPAIEERNLWECEVTQSGEIVVAAGKTNSVEILCKEDGLPKVLVNYSPDLKFYVRHVLVTTSGPVVRQLTSYRKGS